MALRKVQAFGRSFDVEVRQSGAKVRVEVKVEGRVVLTKRHATWGDGRGSAGLGNGRRCDRSGPRLRLGAFDHEP